MSRESTTEPTPAPHSDTGEEAHRPSRASVALGVAVAGGAVAGIVATSRLPAAAVAGLAGLVTGGVLLLVTAQRYRVPKRLCASLLVFVCGLLLLGCVGLVFQSVRADVSAARGPLAAFQRPATVGTLLLVAGVGTAAAGASVTGRGSIRPEDFKSTITVGLSAISLPAVGLAVLAAVELADLSRSLEGTATTVGSILLGHAPGGPIDHLGLVVTWGLVLLAITGARLGIGRLPITELAPSSRRAELTASLRRTQSVLSQLRVLAFVSPIAVLSVEALRTNGAVGLTDAYLRALSTVGTASGLRVLLLGGIAFGVGAVVFEQSAKRLTRLRARRAVRRSVPVATGLLLLSVAVQFGSELLNPVVAGPAAEFRPLIQPLVSQYGPATLVVAALVVVGGAPIGLCFVLLTIDYTLLPEADGAALLSVGLFVAAVGSLLSGRSPLVGFVGVAGSFIAWDITTNAVSLGREVGRAAPTRRTEFVHAGGSLVVAAVGVAVAVIGLSLVRAVPSPPESVAPVAAVVSVVGLFALIFGLRS